MKEHVAASLAGIMLLSSGYDSFSGKALLGASAAKDQPIKANTEEVLKAVGEKNIHDQWQGKSSPTLYDGGFFIRGDLLYWRADEESLDYALVARSTPIESASKAHLLTPHTTWDVGVRIAAGYTFSQQDYWDLTAVWTHFKTHQSGNKSVKILDETTQSLNLIIPTWGSTLLGSTADRASVDWNLSYNTYDLDLGRSYFVSKTFALHPFMGIRGAVIDQKYYAKYNTILATTETIPAHFRAQNNFRGIGAHLGSGLQWYCAQSFSLIGRAAGSLLYADFHMKQTLTTIIDSSGTTILTSLRDRKSTGTVNLEALLGIQWERYFYQNKYRLALSAGYEWNLWFAQNRMIEGNSVPTSTGLIGGAPLFDQRKGDLILQGATFQARFDF